MLVDLAVINRSLQNVKGHRVNMAKKVTSDRVSDRV